MDRKKFFAGIAATTLASTRIARANITALGPPTLAGIPTRAFVANPTLVLQQCPAWCWAASVAMIFASNGHPIDQKTIVQALFGNVQCNTSGNPENLVALINNTAWTDSNGTAFTADVTAAYDATNGVNDLTNSTIVTELANNRPLIYMNQHHAMVLVAMDFMNTPNGPGQVAAMGVLDPFPGPTQGFHPLSLPEMKPATLGGQMFFVGTVLVS